MPSRTLALAVAGALAAGLATGAALWAGVRQAPDDAAAQPPAGQPDRASSGAPATTPAPGPTDSPEVAAEPRLAFLGDSLTEGIGAPPERGYAWQTAEQLGWPVAVIDGVSGSGYVAPGDGRPMPERVAPVIAAGPDVVVVSGGTNDAFQGYPASAVGEAASALLDALRAGLPEADIMVVGPFPTSLEALSGGDDVRAAIRDAALARGLDFVDAWELVAGTPLDTGQWYLSDDGLHPNELGHQAMAEALAGRLGALVR